ncbi:MAG: reprolysin-like metallopeptidase [Bacteroidia bacterium]
MTKLFTNLFLTLTLLLPTLLFTQNTCWKPAPTENGQNTRNAVYFDLDALAMKQSLKATFNEKSAEVQVPLPDGSYATCVVWKSDVLPYKLAKKYPGIKTYSGYVKGAPEQWVKLDYTYRGFHALLQTNKGLAAVTPIDPGVSDRYSVVYKKDLGSAGIHQCGFDDIPRNVTYSQERARARAFGSGVQQEIRQAKQKFNGSMLLFRFAVAATGEYTANHGGTKPLALADITTSVNNLNAIVGRDVNIQFQLVADNDDIIFLNAGTDPYSPNSAFAMLDSNQAVCTRIIGAANYDLGHVVTHGRFGGIASSPATCFANFKGQGYSSNIPSSGPLFDIDYLAHEVGHQLGSPHNFSATSCFNVRANNLNEPGSGTTIMCYAGTCGAGENVEPNSEAMYHSENIADIMADLASPFFSNCATVVPTGNSLPGANAGADFTIPRMTPFHLIGVGTDANNAASLTYSWEQADGDGEETVGLPSPDSVDNALFRTFLPTTSPERTFPNLESIVLNQATPWEVLPDTTRTMSFNFIVRDNHTFLGNTTGDIDTDQVIVTVSSNAAAFELTAPASGAMMIGNTTELVTWNVAGSAAFAPNVTIEMSADSGATYPYMLVASTANDGSEAVSIPAVATNKAIIRVRSAGSGHYFFTRQELPATVSVPLDLRVSDLQAMVKDFTVSLAWDISSTLENERFVLEKKEKDNSDFSPLKTYQQTEVGSQTYTLEDVAVQAGKRYQYRIGMYDPNGSIQYGNIVEVWVPFADQRIAIAPNPVQNELAIQSAETGRHQFLLYTLDGKLLETGSWEGQRGTLSMHKYARGMYMLHVSHGAGSQVFKLVRE